MSGIHDAPTTAPPFAAAADDSPGWYGKLPSLGDFAQRRLPPDFVEAWDGWLAHELSAWQRADPAGWLERYLAGPSWRFMLLPGSVPGWRSDDTMAGVLMPSVDRVGRYFPFTLAWHEPGTPADVPALQRAFAQLHELDDLALDALQEDWAVDRLEDALAGFAQRRATAVAPSPAEARPGRTISLPAPGRAIDLPWRTEIASTLADVACARLFEQWHGGALWWSEPQPGRTRLRLSAGLPRDQDFIALFEATPPALAASG